MSAKRSKTHAELAKEVITPALVAEFCERNPVVTLTEICTAHGVNVQHVYAAADDDPEYGAALASAKAPSILRAKELHYQRVEAKADDGNVPAMGLMQRLLYDVPEKMRRSGGNGDARSALPKGSGKRTTPALMAVSTEIPSPDDIRALETADGKD
mgnify:CR=1 FL=1